MNPANSETPEPTRMERRTAIKWMLTAAASTALLDHMTLAADVGSGATIAKGYGQDPDLLKTYKPGDVWSLTFTAAQRETSATLCDTIIPADEKGPSASSVKVPDFIDEWISAPYPNHDTDKRLVLEGLAWIDTEAQKRFQTVFTKLSETQKNAICDDICYVPNAKPEFRQGAQFFKRFRDLTAGGYYTTPEGMKDIGYVGNVPMARFEGPPQEVLQKLGLV